MRRVRGTIARRRMTAQGAHGRTAGVAMIAALALLVIAGAVMALLFLRTLDDLRHGRDDTAIVQTLLVAHGGANLGLTLLQNDVRFALDEVASARSSTTQPWSFGSSTIDADRPTPASVERDLRPVTTALQIEIDALLCGGPRDLGDGVELQLRIHVRGDACGEAIPGDARLGGPRFVSGSRREAGGNQRYAVPFVMVADGIQGEYRRRVVTQGEYRFVVGRRSFARYALFTDEHVADGASGRIWFTSDTIFDGPVHTNGTFNFYDAPWFGGAVSSAGATGGSGPGAWGYGGDDHELFSPGDLASGGNAPSLDRNGYRNRPRFDDGVDWRADAIALPDNAHDQRTLTGEDGLRFEDDLRSLELFAGDDEGQPVADGESATYQYVRATPDAGPEESYRISPGGVLQEWNGEDWVFVSDRFNGVIYADEHIDRLSGPARTVADDPDSAPPAIAAFSQLTIVPEVGARITGDLTYESPPCEGSLRRADDGIIRATCDDLNAENVLGMFSPSGDILIGNHFGDATLRAPDDVRIHASLLTSDGVVRVENHDFGAPRGAVEVLGGIVEKRYGAFGIFDGTSGEVRSGYARRFTFDPRMSRGIAPPYFPTVGLDGVTDTQTFTFGHREQVY